MSKKYFGASRTVKSQVVNPTESVELALGDTSVIVIPKEMQDSAKAIIESGFRAFADHSRQLADDLADFDKQREEVRREINRGARRTSGRIV